jgi:predicted nucleotidyltransferase
MADADDRKLSELAEALQDHSPEHSWWIDPGTGELELWSEFLADELGEGHPDERGLVLVEPLESGEAYRDMADFTASVPDPDVRDQLERAIAGRGAFRRFKDELYDRPDLRAAWFALSNARMERRAAWWLADHDLIDEATAERLVASRGDPPPPAPESGRLRLATDVAHDLREAFGDRLQQVLVFGSAARGEADPDSDLDLLVVLSEGDGDSWSDRAAMDDVLWDHTLRTGTVVSALPVDARELGNPSRPALIRALADGVPVG